MIPCMKCRLNVEWQKGQQAIRKAVGLIIIINDIVKMRFTEVKNYSVISFSEMKIWSSLVVIRHSVSLDFLLSKCVKGHKFLERW